MLGAAGLADSAAVLLIGGGANTGTLLPGIAGALLCIWSVARAREWPIAVSVHWRRERYILYLGTTLFVLSFVIVQGFSFHIESITHNLKKFSRKINR